MPCNNFDPKSPAFIYAERARLQQAGLGSNQKGNPLDPNARYPSHYGNREGLPLSTPGTKTHPRSKRANWLHHPLKPYTTQTWVSKSVSGPEGAIRSVYTEGNPQDFDVMVHDPKAGMTPNGGSKFSMARYVPKAPQPQGKA